MKLSSFVLAILLICSLYDALAEPIKPAKRLAMLTYSQVKQLDIYNQERLEIDMNKEVVAAFTAQLCRDLFQRGYDIVFCVPMGNSYAGPEPLTSLMSEGRVYESASQQPIYLYPEVDHKPGLAKGAGDLFAQLESVIGTEHWHEFALNKRNLSRLSQATGADIVCVNRVAGLRYTLAKMALERGIDISATLVVMLLAYYSQSGNVFGAIPGIWQTSERLEAHLVCAVSATGDTLWRQAVSFPKNPTKVVRGGSAVSNKVLQQFPRADESVVHNLNSE